MPAQIGLILLASSGFLISAYFLMVKHGIIGAELAIIPRFCRPDKSSCATILNSAEANILGVPNAAVGLAYYLLILGVSSIDSINFPMSFSRWVFLISVAASFTSVSLAFTLLRTLKTNCVLCFTSHFINILISVILYYNL